ncbi:MAG: hypothetical protein DCC68_09770 [Planctomycetota bacterium]|nr:MAG: hypothetical protein DCC68_09770 [Planctomycetota bacterium]
METSPPSTRSVPWPLSPMASELSVVVVTSEPNVRTSSVPTPPSPRLNVEMGGTKESMMTVPPLWAAVPI